MKLDTSKLIVVTLDMILSKIFIVLFYFSIMCNGKHFLVDVQDDGNEYSVKTRFSPFY